MTITKKSKKEYYHLRRRKFIDYTFYKKYIDLEPPFGELGLITYLRTYSRFIPTLNRREKWCEVILRIVEYNIGLDKKTPHEELKVEAKELFDDLFNLRTFLSGRTYWIGGTNVTDNNGSAIFNCTFRQINDISAFSETYYWLLLGAGVGFSVENKCIKQLPDFKNKLKLVHKNYEWKKNNVKNTTLNDTPFALDDLTSSDNDFKQKIFQTLKRSYHKNPIIIEVGDSKEGWATTLRLLLTLYCYTFPNSNIPQILIDYDNVRPVGERLKTFGGRASGHTALKSTLSKIQKCIETRTQKNRLDSVQVTDIVCFIAEGVVAGGVRRSSLISLGDVDDIKFINMKKDLFYDESLSEFRSSRTKSNNSVMIYEKPTHKELEKIIETIKTNGDPGFYFIGNLQKKRKEVKGTNPCAEIALDNKQCCNLTSSNLNAFVKKDENDEVYFDYDDFLRAYRLIVRAGSRMTLVNQWHKDWDKIQKRDRLLGVSMTGIMDAFIKLGLENNLEWQSRFYNEIKEIARQTANEYHDFLGISRSKSVTTTKPEGSLSQLPTVSSGIHVPYASQYQRAIRFSTHDPMSEAMKEMGMQPIPENGQGDELYNKDCDTWIFKFPIRTSTKIRQIDEPALLQLERYKTAMQNYIESHNVSITVNVDENEWNDVINWLDENYDYVGGIALLNKFDPEKVSHPNLPYQPKTESEIEEMEKYIPNLKEEEFINKIAFWETEDEEYEIKEDGCYGGFCPIR